MDYASGRAFGLAVILYYYFPLQKNRYAYMKFDLAPIIKLQKSKE
jgi:hypothetical protein